MKKEIVNFYATKNLNLEKIIARGKQIYGLQEMAIINAAIKLYNEIHAGKQIKDINIAWEIWRIAKNAKFTKRDLMTINELRESNTQFDKSNRYLTRLVYFLCITVFMIAIYHIYPYLVKW